VPAGTPEVAVKKLFAAFTKVMADPTVVSRLKETGSLAITSKSPEEFAAFMREENEKWSQVIKEVGVVMD
jgi:tripartite-type tricarboxylate transporter receptor subunit TctC